MFQLFDYMCVYLGGSVTEAVIFNHTSTGKFILRLGAACVWTVNSYWFSDIYDSQDNKSWKIQIIFYLAST